jgi:hypothetical protein
MLEQIYISLAVVMTLLVSKTNNAFEPEPPFD